MHTVLVAERCELHPHQGLQADQPEGGRSLRLGDLGGGLLRGVGGMALGFVWESAKKYTGVLAAGRDQDDFQFIFRPNIEF